MRTKNSLKWIAIVAIIIACGILLRLWGLPELLHYELDQARDTFVVHDALASKSLPLEGPIARGSDLRLGPTYYYFQILSGILFGISPFTAALPDILMERSDRITYGALNTIANDVAQLNLTRPTIIVGDNRYVRALYYIFTTDHPKTTLVCYVKRSDYEPEYHDHMDILFLTRTRSGTQLPDHRLNDLLKSYVYGTLTLYNVKKSSTSSMRNDLLPQKCHVR